jgi:hypothetical protein
MKLYAEPLTTVIVNTVPPPLWSPSGARDDLRPRVCVCGVRVCVCVCKMVSRSWDLSWDLTVQDGSGTVMDGAGTVLGRFFGSKAP